MQAPTRQEVRSKLVGLVEGDLWRQQVSEWAWQWVGAVDPQVDDPAIWKAVNQLAGADSPSTDREWLFEPVDFRDWLRDLDDTEI